MILTADKVREMMPSKEDLATAFVNKSMQNIVDSAKLGYSETIVRLDADSLLVKYEILEKFREYGYVVELKSSEAGHFEFFLVKWDVNWND